MWSVKTLKCVGMALAMIALVTAPAVATTLQRLSLDDLVSTNGTIVVGEVLDTASYWNKDGTFILTDVRIATTEVLRGKMANDDEITVTVMGGTVGDLTTLILGGAELIPGRSYVLFLDDEDLPGAPQVLTVRDHCQGAFEVVAAAKEGLRAVSQANGHPLVPDALGYTDAPGGVKGFPLAALTQSIRQIAGQVKK